MQIGNYITFYSTNDFDLIKKIERKGNKIYINDINIEDIKYIPINDKILKKFGFKFEPSNEHWIYTIDKQEKIVIMFYKEGLAFFMTHLLDDSEVNMPGLKYVHELQNFFSLHFNIYLVA